MSSLLNIANGPAAAATTVDDAAVWVRGLAKRYGEIEAVRGIDFEVRHGETFGFLGSSRTRRSTAT